MNGIRKGGDTGGLLVAVCFWASIVCRRKLDIYFFSLYSSCCCQSSERIQKPESRTPDAQFEHNNIRGTALSAGRRARAIASKCSSKRKGPIFAIDPFHLSMVEVFFPKRWNIY
jgi:hypothetical protein